MQLNDVEAGRLVAALADAYDLGRLTLLLQGRLGKRIDQLASIRGVSLTVIATQVVQAARQQGWDQNLVEAAIADRPDAPALRDFFEKYRADKPGAADPYETRLLGAGRLFIDRQALRRALRSLSAPDGARVLVIDGPRGSGKTYSFQMIRHLVENLGGHWVLYVDLGRILRPEPEELTATILSRMGGDLGAIPPPGLESPTRRVLRLGDTVQREARRVGGTYWLVFDGCDGTELPPATRDLVLELARRTAEDFAELRVVLLGFAAPLPVEVHDTALREMIPPLGPEDVVDFLHQVCTQRGISLSEAELRPVVERIFQEVPSGVPDRTRRLANATSQVLAALVSKH
jgi:hypothetical protein